MMSFLSIVARHVALRAPLLAACCASALPAAAQQPPAPLIAHRAVTIARDASGAPHVYADTDTGAYRGAGYAAAEDRLFQMCWMRLVVQGRVSEFFGPGNVVNPLTGVVKKTHVVSDRKSRTFGWAKHAAKVVAALDPETRAFLQAYADGVNLRMRESPTVPGGFAGLPQPLEPWSPEDSIGAWLRFGDFFGASGLDEARYLHGWQALLNDPLLTYRERLEQLTGTLICDDTAAVVQEADLPKTERAAMFAYAAAHGLTAKDSCEPYEASPHFSQAWAVAGSRTSTGKAVLVGDPRIGATLPSQLYEWSMQGATFAVRGVGVPGSPNILSGSTRFVAWSPTALGLDQADLLLLTTDAVGHPGKYRLDGQWIPYAGVQLETIHVLGESDVAVLYRETYWGPVVTQEVQDVHAGEEYALHRVPFHDPSEDPARGFPMLYRANEASRFFGALAGWTWPSVNLVFADARGHIGYSVVGTVPVRNPQQDLGGIIAQDGSTSASDWLDLLPQSLKPHVLDPAAGFVLSANHRPIGAWYPIPIRFGSGGSGDTFRSRRLRERLTQASSILTPSQVLDVHHDVVGVAGRDLTEIGAWLSQQSGVVLSVDANRALAELIPWRTAGAWMDNAQRGTLVAASLDLSFRLAEAGPELVGRYGGGENGLNLFLKQVLAKIHFQPAILPTPAEIAYVDAVLGAAFHEAIAIGPAATWQSWYAQHALTIRLPLWTSLEGFPPLAPVQDVVIGPFRAVDANTLLSPLRQSYTQFIEVGAVGKQFSVAPPGNTEPGSAHGLDQIPLWTNETFKPSPMTLLELQQIGAVSVKQI